MLHVYLWSIVILVSEASALVDSHAVSEGSDGLFPKCRNEKNMTGLEVSQKDPCEPVMYIPGFLIN